VVAVLHWQPYPYTCGCIPDLRRPLPARRDDPSSIRTESSVNNGVRVWIARFGHKYMQGAESGRADEVGVLQGRGYLLAGVGIPDASGPIVAGGDNAFTVRAELGVIDGSSVRHRRSRWETGSRIPDSRRSISTWGDHPAAVAAEFSVVHAVVMSAYHYQFRALLERGGQTKPMDLGPDRITLLLFESLCKPTHRGEKVTFVNQPIPVGHISSR